MKVLLSLRLMLFREPDHLMKKPLQIIFAFYAVFALCAFAAAQTGKKNARPVKSEPVQKQGTAGDNFHVPVFRFRKSGSSTTMPERERSSSRRGFTTKRSPIRSRFRRRRLTE
jgi:hypothetical protein